MIPSLKATIKIVGIKPTVNEFAQEFVGKAIYSIGDFYSSYDKFQLAQDSSDITAMRMSLGLVRMCTLLMDATN